MIDTTTEHPFWVPGYGFKEAGELQEGENVETAEGTVVEVIKIDIEKLEEPIVVYNMEVEDWHTYFVSEGDVWVHNDKCPNISESAYKTLAKGKFKHVLNRHSYDNVKKQLKYLLEKSSRADVELDISKRSFFNKN